MRTQDIPPPTTPEFPEFFRSNLTVHNGLIYEGLPVEDETGCISFKSEDEYRAFYESNLTVADYLDTKERNAITYGLRERLPQGDLGDGVCKAVDSVLHRLQTYSRERFSSPLTSDDERYDLIRSERDLTSALRGIVLALDLYAGYGELIRSSPYFDSYYESHASYVNGERGRNGGYIAEYELCTDDFYPDDEDHADILSAAKTYAIQNNTYEEWPDEFHHPAALKIRVDPEKRIEFIYTPEIETAKQRHVSNSTVTKGGRVKEYHNKSLSIRIDLDPTAPHGIALDVGRSAYNGIRDDTQMVRNADLLGAVLSKTSETGSHEYEGFDAGMADEFKNFAERFAVQLDLQNKQHLNEIRQQKLARDTLSIVSRSVA